MSWESRSRPVGPQHDLVERQLVLLVLLLLPVLGVRAALAVHGEESRGEQKQQEHRPPVPRATGHLREKRKKKENKKDRRQTSINLVDTIRERVRVYVAFLERFETAYDEEFEVRMCARNVILDSFSERVSNKILKET